jgi:hypothetical protein
MKFRRETAIAVSFRLAVVLVAMGKSLPPSDIVDPAEGINFELDRLFQLSMLELLPPGDLLFVARQVPLSRSVAPAENGCDDLLLSLTKRRMAEVRAQARQHFAARIATHRHGRRRSHRRREKAIWKILQRRERALAIHLAGVMSGIES